MAVFKIAGLDPTLVDQALEAVVDLSQADTQFFGQFSLADVGVVFQAFEEIIVGLFTQKGIPCSVVFGKAVSTLPPYCVILITMSLLGIDLISVSALGRADGVFMY